MICEIHHAMGKCFCGDGFSDPHHGNLVKCELEADHLGDCIVQWRGEKWRVSQIGYEDHPPERFAIH